jgi:hypothetical protein
MRKSWIQADMAVLCSDKFLSGVKGCSLEITKFKKSNGLIVIARISFQGLKLGGLKTVRNYK